MSVARVDQYAFRLRDVDRLSIGSWQINVRQMPRSDQLLVVSDLLLRSLSLSQSSDCHNRSQRDKTQGSHPEILPPIAAHLPTSCSWKAEYRAPSSLIFDEASSS